MNENTIEQHVRVADADTQAVALLHAATGLPKQRIKHAMACGAVWLTRARSTARLRRATRSLQVGDELHLYYNPSVLAEEPITPRRVADEGAFSVWDKPSGLRSQGSRWGDHCTVMRFAETHLQPKRNAFTVHRLDRAASGLMLIAHTKKAAANLSSQFRNRAVEKRYRAIVSGDASAIGEAQIIELPIDAKPARSMCRFIECRADQAQSVVEVAIETGRKHQIRRHLQHIGFPIVGDRLYGGATKDDVDLQLRSVFLSFTHPETGESVTYDHRS
ncbi:MAG: RluA family pseudouridine synthase [Pseudomonadota bacterium]